MIKTLISIVLLINSLLVYSQTSNMLWRNYYSDSSSFSRDVLVDGVLSKQGNLYITGYTENNISNYDITTIALDSSHNVKWKKSYSSWNKSFSFESPTKIWVDNDENIYVSGTIQKYNGSTSSAILLKYDKDGNLLWNNIISNLHGRILDKLGIDIVADNAGNCYFLCYNTGFSDSCSVILKYNKQGSIVWERYMNDHTPVKLVIEKDKYLYAFGKGYYKFEINKFDTAGLLVWKSNYTTPNKYDFESFKDVVIDSKSNLYMATTIYPNNLLGTSDWDALISCFDGNGHLIWDRVYNGTGNGMDCVTQLQLFKDSILYVGLTSKSQDNLYDAIFLEYNKLGDKIDSLKLNGQWNNDDYLYSFCLDTMQNIYATGTSYYNNYKFLSWTCKINPLKTIEQYKYLPISDSIRTYPLRLFKNKSISIVGNVRYTINTSLPIDTHSDYFYVRLDSLENVLSCHTCGEKGTSFYDFTKICLDSKGNSYVSARAQLGPIYLSGEYYYNYHFVLQKYDSNGFLKWSNKIDVDSLKGWDFIGHFITSDTLITFVANAYSAIPRRINNSKSDSYTLLYNFNSEGKLLSKSIYDNLSPKTIYSWYYTKDANVDRDGNLYIYIPKSNTDTSVLIKFNNKLEKLWEYKESNYASSPNIRFSNDGSIIYNINNKFIKLNKNGEKIWENNLSSTLNTINDYVIDKYDNIYITGLLGDYNCKFKLIKLDSNGNKLWDVTNSNFESGKKILLQSNQDIVVLSKLSGNPNYANSALLKYSEAGQLIKLILPNLYFLNSNPAYIDNNDNIYLFNDFGFNEGNYSNFFLKYSPDLELLYKQVVENDSIMSSFCFGNMQVDNNNDLIVTGNMGNTFNLQINEWSTLTTIKFKQKNQNPKLCLSPKLIKVVSGDTIKYTVIGKDYDGDKIYFGDFQKIKWISVDSLSGVLTGITNGINNGIYKDELFVRDEHGAINKDTLIIKVGNDPPVFVSTPVMEASINQQYFYQAIAQDVYGSKIKYQLKEGPSWLTSDTLGRIQGTPGLGDLGKYRIKIAACTLYGDTSVQEYQIEVKSLLNSLNNTINDLSENLVVYPNPVVDKLIINFNKNIQEDASIYIYNNLGQIVNEYYYCSTNICNKVTLDFNNVRSGIYYIKIYTDKFLYNKGIIVIKK